MSLVEAIRSALSAIGANALRSALTMLGIIIGVAAVIAMVAIGSGARERVDSQIKSLGANLAIIQAGNVTQGGVRLGAIAYDKANPTSSSSSTTDSTSSTDSATSTTSVASSDKTDAQVFRQLMELLRTYGDADDSTKNLLSTLVTSA